MVKDQYNYKNHSSLLVAQKLVQSLLRLKPRMTVAEKQKTLLILRSFFYKTISPAIAVPNGSDLFYLP